MAGHSNPNPWADTNLLSGIKLGCPENGLLMARQFSLQRVSFIHFNEVKSMTCIYEQVHLSSPAHIPCSSWRVHDAPQSVLPRSGSTVSNYPMSRYVEAVRKASDLQDALNEVRWTSVKPCTMYYNVC